MPFDDMLAPLDAGESTDVLPGWGQGRATFGGVVAALLYRRAAVVLAQRAGGEPPPARSLSFSLVAPLAPGGAQVTVEVLRAGKNVTQLEARLLQDGQVVATMLGSFGASRPSSVLIAPPPAPAFPAPGASRAFPFVAGLTPDFMQHFEFRWAVGQLPFSAPLATTGDMGGWVRFREPTRGFGLDHLLGLVDAWPPAVLPMFAKPAPISTLAWTIEFTDASLPTRGDAFVQYLAQTDFSTQGYAHIHSRTWRADGALLAIGRQTVAIFA